MRFLFLNQYAPPDPSPTARLLGEVADHLRSLGHEVDVVAHHRDYHGRLKGGRGRMRQELTALFTMMKRGWRVSNKRPDVIVALSSPPGLLFVAAILARLRRRPLVHWAMDLYPELAVALGEIRPGAAYRIVRACMSWAYRRAALIVALDEDMQAHLRENYGVDSKVLAPWPARSFERQIAVAGNRHDTKSRQLPGTWLYSGNLGRAHEWKTLLDAQRLLEDRSLPVRLVFQGDGAARPAAVEYARQLDLQRCEWKGYAEEDGLAASLLDARVLIVTQRPETRGLLWPSKLSAMEALPRNILFVGPVEGAIAKRLIARGNTGVFAPGCAGAVAEHIEKQFLLDESTANDKHPQFHESGGCDQLARWLLGGF